MPYKDIEKKKEAARKSAKKNNAIKKVTGGKDWIIMKCKKCSNNFYILKGTLKRNRGQYCSQNCRRNREIKICEGCGIKFIHKITSSIGKFCSQKCNGKYQKRLTGKQHPFFVHGHSNSKEYWKLKSHERRVKKRNSGGTYTIKEWDQLKKKFKYTCPSCFRKEPQIKLTIDHILPISLGGTNYISNIQPLCKSCNSAKNNRAIKWNPKGQQEIIFEEIAWPKLVQEADQIFLGH